MTSDADLAFFDHQRVAGRVAARAQIRDVRLVRTKANLHREPEPGRTLSYDISFTPAVDFNAAQGNWFVVRIACQLAIEITAEDITDPADTDDDPPEFDTDDEHDPNKVASADFEYAALFDCTMREGDDPLSETELNAYAETTARFALYPFMREYIYDMTGRLALPPLTLGVLDRPMHDPHPATAVDKTLHT